MKKRMIYALISVFIIAGIIFVSSINLDLNHDGIINITDLQLLASHFQGKAAYNSTFDLNGNGKVDLYDLVSAARQIDINGSGDVTPYFEDSFETGDFSHTENGFTWNSIHTNVNINSNPLYSHSGTHSMAFTYPGVPPGSDNQAQQGFEIAQNASSSPKEIWMEWYLMFPNNYVYRSNESPDNNKFFYVWAEQYSAPTDAMAGLEYESSVGGNITPHLVIHGTNSNGETSQQASVDNAAGTFEANPFFDPLTVPDTWVHIQVHLRLGNNSTDNGTLEIWFDGVPKVRITDYMIYPYSSPVVNYLRNGYLMGWANAGFTNDTTFYIDDFKFYTKDPYWNLS